MLESLGKDFVPCAVRLIRARIGCSGTYSDQSSGRTVYNQRNDGWELLSYASPDSFIALPLAGSAQATEKDPEKGENPISAFTGS